ncbi:PREDICTED: uncharacterized protein LOC106899816 [Calidris pugnax]|uniref:uncharacterized protein LOC106899816 n=1 Tax=Calidris pugnax TaxID=198806 RepID=UPI00071E5DAF|nr:PREDICTED: uncharacterized protein LOC106899816 [Calidris pugnax]
MDGNWFPALESDDGVGWCEGLWQRVGIFPCLTQLWEVLQSQWKKVQHGMRLGRARLEERSGEWPHQPAPGQRPAPHGSPELTPSSPSTASPPGDGGGENSRDSVEVSSREGPSPGAPQASLDSVSSPGSPPAVATGKGDLMLELLHALQAQQEVMKKCCEMLQAELAQQQGTTGTRDGTPPREPSHPLGRMETREQPGARMKPPHLGAEDMDKAEDGDLGRSSGVGPGRSPMELESRDKEMLGRPRDLPAAKWGSPGFIKAHQGCPVSPVSWGRGCPWV